MYLCICNCLQETGQCATVYVLVTVYRKRDDVPQKMIWSYMAQLRARVKFMAISQNHGCDKQDSLAGLSCKSGPFLGLWHLPWCDSLRPFITSHHLYTEHYMVNTAECYYRSHVVYRVRQIMALSISTHVYTCTSNCFQHQLTCKMSPSLLIKNTWVSSGPEKRENHTIMYMYVQICACTYNTLSHGYVRGFFK